MNFEALRFLGVCARNRLILRFQYHPCQFMCCFTAQSRIDDALTQKITSAFLSMRYDNPEHREILDLEHCKAFVPGTTEGFDTLEKAAEAEGLIA